MAVNSIQGNTQVQQTEQYQKVQQQQAPKPEQQQNVQQQPQQVPEKPKETPPVQQRGQTEGTVVNTFV
jgi:hypothetical protein